MYTYIPSLWLIPPTSFIPFLQVIMEQFSTSCFTHGSIFMSALLSDFVLPTASCPTSTSMFSTSASLFLLYQYVYQYHFSRFHIYELIYDICFPLQTSFLKFSFPWWIPLCLLPVKGNHSFDSYQHISSIFKFNLNKYTRVLFLTGFVCVWLSLCIHSCFKGCGSNFLCILPYEVYDILGQFQGKMH